MVSSTQNISPHSNPLYADKVLQSILWLSFGSFSVSIMIRSNLMYAMALFIFVFTSYIAPNNFFFGA